MTTKLLEGKTAVVTGSASGIGFAIAERFAEHGAQVVISDIREEAATEGAKRLTDRGLSARSFVASAAVEDDIKNLLKIATDTYGSLDVLVNNAGMQYISSIEDFPVDKFKSLIDLMLVGPFMSIKHAFPIMKKQKYGRILNIASINGLVGFAGKAAYNSAKHGLIGLTKVAALEGATDGITVNAICPGYVDTPLVQNQLLDLAKNRGVTAEQVMEDVLYQLIPQRRLLEPSEIADYALFLASHKARSITGQTAVIDGGYLAQ